MPISRFMEQPGHDFDLPMADQIRERTALELFPFRELAPDEWAARHAHETRWFNFHQFHYRDPGLDQWLQALGRLLVSPTELEAARRRHLSHPERFRIAAAKA